MTSPGFAPLEERVSAPSQSIAAPSNNGSVPPTPTNATGTAEEADNYRSVLFQASPECRVIECRAALQWIVQTRAGRRRTGDARWRSRSYCTTVAGLSRTMRELVGFLDPASRSFLGSLPPHHPGAAR